MRIPRLLWLALILAAVRVFAAMPPVTVARPTHPGAGQVFYFVLTDRFANGSTANDTGGFGGGPDEHGFDPTRISHFHGGDFAGLTAQLDYLKALGVTAVWVTPSLKNKPVQAGTAGYHGYWITDFLQIDPHLGTNEEFRAFIRDAHARGIKVFMDIITNHTADVIGYRDGEYSYRPKSAAPYRDASGRPFDERTVAFNGLNDPAAFPALSIERSFPYVPAVPPAEAAIKRPAWLNDLTLYHNRGNTTFQGENAVHGDFVGLDDLFTEHPRVVQGMIEIFRGWLESGVDGFRIDTVKHVNPEFWQAFSPAIRARARELGRPDFLQFAEVYNEAGDSSALADYSTQVPIDTTLDFGFFNAARRFVSQAGDAAALAEFFDRDDYYIDHDSNVHATTTFLGNHDAGRFAYFLQQDNPRASRAELEQLVRLGHGLLFLARGQPVIYYGDEQGMTGTGNDMRARESMFASQASGYKELALLGTTRTGADDKFDPAHPFYRFFARLAAVRAGSPAFARGTLLPRPTGVPAVAAFSRLERDERVEYLVVLNNSRTTAAELHVPTSQPAGARMRRWFDSASDGPGDGGELATIDDAGRVAVKLAPLQFVVWRAEAPLGPIIPATLRWAAPQSGAVLTFASREIDGTEVPIRQELRVEVGGGDGVGAVTFLLQRKSRPGQLEYLGTDDTPPYRIFWRPPADWAADDTAEFVATFDNLRGGVATARLVGVTVAPTKLQFGIAGATVPRIVEAPVAELSATLGETVEFTVRAEGTGPLEFQWLREGIELPGATAATLRLAKVTRAEAGSYRVMVRNREGTTLSAGTKLNVTGLASRADIPRGRREGPLRIASQHVAERDVWVWLPPGYAEGGAERYPVIYAHDGQNLFDPARAFGGESWEIDRALERLLAAGRIRPAIVVGVANTERRVEEYLPQRAVAGLPAAALRRFPIVRGELSADRYLRLLVEELKPEIDRRYRTLPGRGDTFVLGSSMGGLISVYAVAEYPNVFGGAACLSTHWPAADGAVIDYLEPRLAALRGRKLYFDLGTAALDASYPPFQRRMDAALRKAGWREGGDWITRVFPGAEHNEKAWQVRVEEPLEFLLGRPDKPQPATPTGI